MKYFKLFEEYHKDMWYHGSKRNEIIFDKRNDSTNYNMSGFGLYLTSSKEEAKYYVLDKTNSGYVHTILVSDSANILDYSERINDSIKESMLMDESFYDGFKRDIQLDFDDYEYRDGNNVYSWDSDDDGFFIYDENNDSFAKKGMKEDDVIPTLKELIGNSENKIDTGEIEVDPLEFYYPKSGKIDVLNKDDIFNSMYHLLQYLYYKFDSTKTASEYMVKHGIDGIYSEQDTSDIGYDEGARVLVCYNPNIYKIEKTELIKNE